ncbi:sigma-70 family RNA polymerase sigma factor [Chitinophaga agrisoli]|uniref:Sigma-70 family RNA polymerase sigma factor n=1 Tax=Chitinophaga agrisoli TaxID=2607653 RepID=A0A5B2W0T5_9BACT|nr:sigma-70 family RNA polymerase sigma factor [Chitinophaga agrisoli]KAA2244548.1 sigma-70 family RNA polymerase sigma factor [Chitinophaga agrisoli]
MENYLIDDTSLLSSLKSGDYAAFNTVYRLYSKTLYLFLQYRLQDEDLCSDILQDIFVALWEKRATLQPDGCLEAYLHQIARFKIVDIYRKNIKSKKYFSDFREYFGAEYYVITETLDHKSNLAAVMHTIDQLPRKMKKIFMLSRFEHFTVDNIATRLAISPQTVKNQLTKALRILRTHHTNIDLSVCFIFLLHHALTFFLKK